MQKALQFSRLGSKSLEQTCREIRRQSQKNQQDQKLWTQTHISNCRHKRAPLMLRDRSNEEWPFRGMHNKIVASALKAQIIFILRDTKVKSSPSLILIFQRQRFFLIGPIRGDNKFHFLPECCGLLLCPSTPSS